MNEINIRCESLKKQGSDAYQYASFWGKCSWRFHWRARSAESISCCTLYGKKLNQTIVLLLPLPVIFFVIFASSNFGLLRMTHTKRKSVSTTVLRNTPILKRPKNPTISELCLDSAHHPDQGWGDSRTEHLRFNQKKPAVKLDSKCP